MKCNLSTFPIMTCTPSKMWHNLRPVKVYNYFLFFKQNFTNKTVKLLHIVFSLHFMLLPSDMGCFINWYLIQDAEWCHTRTLKLRFAWCRGVEAKWKEKNNNNRLSGEKRRNFSFQESFWNLAINNLNFFFPGKLLPICKLLLWVLNNKNI